MFNFDETYGIIQLDYKPRIQVDPSVLQLKLYINVKLSRIVS